MQFLCYALICILYLSMESNCEKGSVLITGGTGFIGRALQFYLRQKGYVVNIVSRKPGPNTVTWDTLDKSGLPAGTQAVVNLVGQNILQPGSLWTEQYKKDVYSSRVNRTQDLVKQLLAANQSVKAFVSFSGVGIYEPSTDKVYDEHTPLVANDSDFFQTLTRDWESAAQAASKQIRTTIIRSGVVLGNGGGMINVQYWPFFFGLGGPVSPGTQPLPWIHIHDMVRIIRLAIENESVRGVVNGVAPQIVTNAQFSRAFAAALNRPCLFTVPGFVLKLVYSPERARIILEGQKVAPKRLLEEFKYEYKYPIVDAACKETVAQFWPKTPFLSSHEK
ncbi:epimerase family protein SDR39U1 isoform X3 [Diaphorina citri]|uniref:Epimerase family protein SDR39U1 isoform X3 n=1 Tax=Diaphorina citri TaxID=121845 RepID=A0A3Q0J149_DIACI|nr:epimerase family protein SDR39U1 isoform X3 [Diaphorina citri]